MNKFCRLRGDDPDRHLRQPKGLGATSGSNIARVLVVLALFSSLVGGVQAKTPEELIDDARRNQQGLGQGSGGAGGDIAGVWGWGKCVVIESYRTDYNKKRIPYDLDGKEDPWIFGTMHVVKEDGGCRVMPDTARAGLKEAVTSNCEGTHVHVEYISDGGVRGYIHDFTLEGAKLIGTHTDFDTYHGSRTVNRCEVTQGVFSAEEMGIESPPAAQQPPQEPPNP
jgi:hypothetical protein